MMSVNNNEMDLTLGLGYSDQPVWTKPNNDSGAGVNAGSGLHIFAASDPLSELVWSPKKGVCLKCADNRLAHEKPFLIWNVVAPSDDVSTPSEIIRFDSINDEKDIGKESTDGMEKLNPAEVVGIVDANQNMEHLQNDPSNLQNIQMTRKDEDDENCPEVSAQNEARLLRNNSLPLEASPTNTKTSHRKRKGKGKSLSDGDNAITRMLSSEESSHESLESCNSTMMFPERKKLENIEQPLFLGCKRLKKQMQRNGVLAPTSTFGHDSSFMTWISNMVNGSSKTVQEEAPSLPLSLNTGHEGNHYGFLTCDKNQNIGSRNMELKTMFHPLSCLASVISEKRIEKDDLSVGGSKDVFLDDKMIIEATPIMCHQENDGSDDKINTEMEEVSTKSPIMSQNVASVEEACKSTSAENKASGSLSCSKTEKGESSSASHHSENKPIKNMSGRSSLLSFWIPRFSAQGPNTVLNLGDETTNCAKSNPNARITSEFLIDHKDSEPKLSSTEEPGNDMLKGMSFYALNADASIGVKEECAKNCEKSAHKLNPIIPSPRFKSSEALTLFAKRLDAFKHIIPPDARNEATVTKEICLFCGRSGHDICNCSDATESDQVDLLRNISSYDWTENSHILCVRCLRLDHWATTCPMASSGRQYWREHANSCINHNSTINLFTFGSKETASVPKGAFDAIRRLRLSRGDILKWLNSDASLSHLDGFFLRLRLGRWEGGLEKTGYYIARIAGSQREYSTKGSKKCISVSICGITCSVGSQYVSNHDFLEDELMTWWCKTSESGGQVPSEDELRLKVEKRMKLGF